VPVAVRTPAFAPGGEVKRDFRQRVPGMNAGARARSIPMRRRNGFTLIELLVVVGIIALLVSILLPVLGRTRRESQRVVCLSNLRQMETAAEAYANDYDARYPIAYYKEIKPTQSVSYAWDFTTTLDAATRTSTVVPGILWQGRTIMKIQQCPSFTGKANWLNDPYTGYNYNTSYIGHGANELIVAPARVTEVRSPSHCALFGDGEYQSGANKFMRSPWPSPADEGFSRSSGTQGFRHLGRTNVAFCDGHGESLAKAYKETDPAEVEDIAPGTGFLSADNSLYDLD
jgi:prepilin-type N-terminal cleavage/methylation domain-containing protein/prepilin-type processing-associated H-X9-DG protein